MRIQLVSHASVILWTTAGGLWSDPWLKGKAFNDSWGLWPEAAFDNSLLDGIGFLWISHEHPDHFHIPSLRSLPESFKQRVTVLFQEKNSEKLFDAMRTMGYRDFKTLPDGENVPLGKGVIVNCRQVGFIDSVLSVREPGAVVVNVNDADLGDRDIQRIKEDVGRPNIVLNQFSLAGYDGYADREQVLPRIARHKLESLIRVHRAFDAECTVPFASFCYFCTADNWYVNQFANTVERVIHEFADANARLMLLYPGDVAQVGVPWDNSVPEACFREASARFGELVPAEPVRVQCDELSKGFASFVAQLRERFPTPLVSAIDVLRFRVLDLDAVMHCDFRRGEAYFENNSTCQADIELYAQPLLFGFTRSFGFETLAVACRFTVLNNRKRWRRLKAISILNNQEIYLRPRLVNVRTIRYLAERMSGGLLRQIREKARLRASHAAGAK
jgi:UDP-MurNAc hydroxylase